MGSGFGRAKARDGKVEKSNAHGRDDVTFCSCQGAELYRAGHMRRTVADNTAIVNVHRG
jgi:hypothetical protein